MTELALIAVGILNGITFLAFGLDKRRARADRRRISERRLLGLSWATGLFGGWLGMTVFRHKTRKLSFQAWMVVISVLNPIWAVGWWVLLRP